MVVPGDAMQIARVAAAKVAEPSAWRFTAWQVVFPNDAEQMALERRQATVLPSTSPESTSRKQQVDVIECAQWIA